MKERMSWSIANKRNLHTHTHTQTDRMVLILHEREKDRVSLALSLFLSLTSSQTSNQLAPVPSVHQDDARTGWGHSLPVHQVCVSVHTNEPQSSCMRKKSPGDMYWVKSKYMIV